MNKPALLGLGVIGAIAVGAVLYFGLSAAPGDTGVKTGAKDNSIVAQPVGGQQAKRMTDTGSVQVEVTFKAPQAAQPMVFEVAMNTHSVNLDGLEMTRLAKLSLQPGGTVVPLVWKAASEGGGHHVSGTLTADADPALLKKAEKAVLELSGIGGEEIRRYEWPVGGQ